MRIFQHVAAEADDLVGALKLRHRRCDFHEHEILETPLKTARREERVEAEAV